jgi:hypothetical protein
MSASTSTVARCLAVAALSSLASVSSPVKAELLDDSERLLAAWRARGMRAERAVLMFVEAGETRRIALPPPGRRGPGCTTVVALAARGVRFAFQEVGASPSSKPRAPVKSAAGVATLSDCGIARPLHGVAVTGGSPRGTVELLVTHHGEPPPPVATTLPTRAVGPTAPDDRPGAIAPAPLAERVRRGKEAARLAGAAHVVRVDTKATSRGSGALLMRLSAGCHRIVVLAQRAAGGQGHDLDAEIQMRGADGPQRRDRSHAPDAIMGFCLGRSGPVELRYAGAPADAPVAILDGHWPTQQGLPARWGHAALGAVGWALHRRRLPPIRRAPEREMLGGPGVTNLSFELDPDACYLAAFGVTRGAAGAARISARVGERRYRDDAPDVPRSGAVTFCAEGERSANVQVDVRSANAWWRMGLWRLAEVTP